MKQQRKRIRKCIAILMTLAMVLSLGAGCLSYNRTKLDESQ